MPDFKEGLIIGCFFSVVLSLCLAVNVDENFEYTQKRNERFIEICEGLNSTPQSFDAKELTCKNGLTVEYRKWFD